LNNRLQKAIIYLFLKFIKEEFSMPTVEFEGNTFNVDEDGFIDNFTNYNEAWVKYVKHQEGIDEMTKEHWDVINILQDYYKKNGIAPMVRILSKLTGFKLKHIYELFPSGPGKGACKMAGLPKPTGCV
jgi:dissimilatory sulfite reductase related protein